MSYERRKSSVCNSHPSHDFHMSGKGTKWGYGTRRGKPYYNEGKVIV
jgi:hypothetical protein